MSKKLLLAIVSVLLSAGSNAQEIITAKALGKVDKTVFKNLDEVNALVFKPLEYDTVANPRLPDSLSLMMLSKVEAQEMYKKRIRFNPYLAFHEHIEFKKEDIFIGFSIAWIRLSSYYKYNNDSLSVEEYRKKVNQNIVNKNLLRYGSDSDLLEDVNNASIKLINADTVFIYDNKVKYKFKDTVDNYGALIVHLVKFDLGYVSLKYYYPLNKRKTALSEINKTWGIIQFKPDREFTHPNRDGWIPPQKEPELYFGKFSFLNNPEQVKRENEQYKQRKLKAKSSDLAIQAATLVRSNNIEQAKRKLTEALQIDSNNTIAYRHLLLMSMDENNRNDSRKYLNKLIEIDAKNTATWFFKGLVEKKYNELDSAARTFEMIIREKDPLHFNSFVELALLSIQKGDHAAADQNFNRAINIFKAEGEKSLRKEGHRMFNINDLFRVRLAYGKFLITNSNFEKSKMLFEQTLREEKAAVEAGKKGERRSIYGTLTPVNLAELNFMLALSYAGLKDEPNTRLYLEKAKSLGKVLPEKLEGLLNNQGE